MISCLRVSSCTSTFLPLSLAGNSRRLDRQLCSVPKSGQMSREDYPRVGLAHRGGVGSGDDMRRTSSPPSRRTYATFFTKTCNVGEMNARGTSARHNGVTEIREIRAVGIEHKLCLKAQRYRNLSTPSEVSSCLLQNGRCHNGEMASPRRTVRLAAELRNTFSTQDKDYHG